MTRLLGSVPAGPQSRIEVLAKEPLIADVPVPDQIFNLDQAHAYFQSAVKETCPIVDILLGTPDFPLRWKLNARYRRVIDSWYRRLNEFLVSHPCDSRIHLLKSLHLNIQYHKASILLPYLDRNGIDRSLRSEHPDSELHFDNRMGEFRTIISYATEYLSISIPVSDSMNSEATRLSGWGILPELFFCATRCRCPSLRRTALHLLQSRRWREDSWNSSAAAAVAARIIKLEEEGASSIHCHNDVSSDSRVRLLGVHACRRRQSEENHANRVVVPARQDAVSNDFQGSLAGATFDLSFGTDSSWVITLSYVKKPWDLSSPIQSVELGVECLTLTHDSTESYRKGPKSRFMQC